VFVRNANPALGVDALTATNRDTMGLVTRFTVQEIPEPATALLFIPAVLTALGSTAVRRRRSASTGPGWL
jgi:hypothetical protein